LRKNQFCYCENQPCNPFKFVLKLFYHIQKLLR
jgi:hypothetical protein